MLERLQELFLTGAAVRRRRLVLAEVRVGLLDDDRSDADADADADANADVRGQC